MKRLTRVFAETTHGTKGYESINKIKVDTESIHNLSEIITTLGELEDVLEKYGIESAEELDGVLKPLIDNGELENWESATFWKMQTERLKKELAELKQSQNEKAIKVLEMMIEEIRSLNMPNKPELYNNDMFVTGFESHYLGVERIIDNQIKSLKGEE